MLTTKQIIVQVSLIALAWFVSGYLFAGAVSVAFLRGEFFSLLAYRGALINTIIGTVLMALITATPRGRDLFYAGSDTEDGGGHVLIWLVLTLPIPCVFVGIFWLVLNFLARLIGLWKL